MKLVVIIGIALLIFGGLFFMMTQQNKSAAAPSEVTFGMIQADINHGSQLIDVRTPAEYSSGHIDGSINLSLQDIQAGKMPTTAKDKKLYVYCHSGNRSGQATNILKTAGYQDIVDLGGISHVQSMGGVIK